MNVSPAAQSAVTSGLLSLKPYVFGVILGVLTLALGTGATDNKGLMDAVGSHWILWTVSSIVTLIGGSGARTLQKYQYVRSVQAGTANTATSSAYVDPSTKVVVGPKR